MLPRGVAKYYNLAPQVRRGLSMKTVTLFARMLAVGALAFGNTLGASESSVKAESALPGPWQSLVEGNTAKAWRGWKSPALPPGWQVDHGELFKKGDADDLVTREEYSNFELELDWKLDTGGNSGIFYRGTREYDEIYWSGPEYQLLDDANARDGRSRLTAAGSDYGLYPALAGVVRPANQWNTSRLVVNGAHVEHWLNGRKIVEYELWSPDWQAKVAASKFAAYPHYGLARTGYIGIQGDHPGALTLRHIRIRRLP